MGYASASYTMALAPSASSKNNVTSPIPYLLTGIALMLALIGLALMILACSYSKSYSSSHGERESKAMGMEVDSEPKIVVIMAGDSNPTYLAKPVPSTHHEQPN